MSRLIINNLGPIERCELEISHFTTLIGAQASGKSTIAKAIYYFRTIKDDIVNLAKAQALNADVVSRGEKEYDVIRGLTLKKGLENYLREKFLRTFGSSWAMSMDMYIEYHYTDTCSIKISLVEDIYFDAPNYIWITISEDLKNILKERDHCFVSTPLGVDQEEVRELKTDLCNILDDQFDVVYIPAGRSMITLLSQQLGYIYATMDDVQKRSIDSCTKDYLERILRLKSEFSLGLQQLAVYASKEKISAQIIKQAQDLIYKILKGTYRYNNGEEQIYLENGKYVKINFSSSGQQESVWILNLLFYYLIQTNPVLFIIEEPESHLFPDSQKYITELISLVSNCGHSVLLTTHSPYVLGTLNNLLYAKVISEKYAEKVNKMIPASLMLDYKTLVSWFVRSGTLENGMDSDIHMIQNEKIDEISKVINKEFDNLLELQETDEKGNNE